jgi:catechol 2,3-dioxygenase-like lactoylglutathione lyase family enzyme
LYNNLSAALALPPIALMLCALATPVVASEPSPLSKDIPSVDLNKDGQHSASVAADRWPAIMSTAMRSSDLDRSLRFYTVGLGMVVQGKVVAGPSTEVILGFEGHSDRAGVIVSQTKGPTESLPVDHGNENLKIVLGVADVVATAARLKAAGYSAGEIRSNGGYKILVTHDPDGYTFEIVEHPKSQ